MSQRYNLLSCKPDQKPTRLDLKGVIATTLTLSLIFQSALATTQVFLGHSIGGLLYYLGERTIAVGQPNIAIATFMGHIVLRGYGTFGHPNVLAGWTVISFLIILLIYKRSEDTKGRFTISLSLIFTVLTILLTQSRAAALTLFGLVIPFYLVKTLKVRISYFFLLTLLVSSFSLLSPDRSELSSVERLDLQGVSLSVIRNFPIMGTGAQASISTYQTVNPNFRILQPDHNSFTLLLSWFGLFGVVALIPGLLTFISRLLPILPLLLFDHYLFTSPQGLFIFLFYFIVAVNYIHAQKNI